MVVGGEGGAYFAAQGEGAWWLIVDESPLADLLGDDDVDAYVTIRRFDDERSWQAAIDERRAHAGQAEWTPDRFAIATHSGGLGGPAVTIAWTGLDLLYERRDPMIGPLELASIEPTPQQWTEFWAASDRAGVWKWRPSYDDLAADDAPGWKLTLARGAFEVDATGDNTWPEQWEAFCRAVRRLVDGRPFF